MKRIKYTLVFAALFFASVNLKSQEPGDNGAFSLKQAIEFALKNSPSAKNGQLDIESAVHRKKETTGLGLPQINGSVDIKNYFEIPTSLIPAAAFSPTAPADLFIPVKFGTKYNATAGFNASQLIFSSDYIFALKASEQFLSLSRINLERTQAELAAEVSKAYYTAIINVDRLKLLDINVARLESVLRETRAFNEQGLVELIDVERLEVQYNNLISQKGQTEKLVGVAETMLKFQMGYDLDKPITLTDSLAFNESEYQDIPTGKIDVSKRPEYQLALTQQRLLKIDHQRYQWGYLPTLSAYGTYQWNTMRQKTDFLDFEKDNPLKTWFKIGLVGVTLNLNIFDGLQRHHKIQQARIEFEKTANSIRNIELGAELEATVAAVKYNNAYSHLLIQKKNMELAQHVVEVAKKKYENGVGSNIEVVNAEADSQQAEINYYNAVYDMLIAKTDYKKATGTILK